MVIRLASSREARETRLASGMMRQVIQGRGHLRLLRELPSRYTASGVEKRILLDGRRAAVVIETLKKAALEARVARARHAAAR